MTIYVIGSQAVYGAYPEFELDVVFAPSIIKNAYTVSSSEGCSFKTA
jgi:hypothetical protein